MQIRRKPSLRYLIINSISQSVHQEGLLVHRGGYLVALVHRKGLLVYGLTNGINNFDSGQFSSKSGTVSGTEMKDAHGYQK